MPKWKFDRSYDLARLGGDAAGGLVAALIALPYGLAMAYLMGLPPILGIFTSLITAPVCALLGRNPVLIGGTSSVTVPFIASAVSRQGLGGAAKVCVVAAIIMLIFCVLRLGQHVSKVPYSVLAGFSCGIGAMMVISQLRIIFGLGAPRGGWGETMLSQLLQIVQNIGHAQAIPAVTAAAVAVVASLAALAVPRSPAPLFGVLGAVLLARIFGWQQTQIGALPFEMPPFAGFSWEPSDIWTVLPQAFGLAVVSSVNLLITSRVVTHFLGRRQHIKKHDADLELGAYGIANLLAGVFAAPTSVGIPARSLANVQCGGTSRLSNLIHALFLVGFLTLGARFIAQIPLAALAGVTAWMGVRLLDWSAWRRLPKMRGVDALAFVATAISTLIVNAIAAVAIGCACFFLHYLYRQITKRGEPRQAKGMVV